MIDVTLQWLGVIAAVADRLTAAGLPANGLRVSGTCFTVSIIGDTAPKEAAADIANNLTEEIVGGALLRFLAVQATRTGAQGQRIIDIHFKLSEPDQ